MKVKKPYRGNTLVANHLRVAAAKAGIIGPVGWRTFRRSISTWLIDNDENVKVTQELMDMCSQKLHWICIQGLQHRRSDEPTSESLTVYCPLQTRTQPRTASFSGRN
jgi:hypothetical protein